MDHSPASQDPHADEINGDELTECHQLRQSDEAFRNAQLMQID